MDRAKAALDPMNPALALTGPVTLAEVARVRESILSAMRPSADLRLDLSATGPWDLSGLQLILSAGVTARRSGRRLILERVPEMFRALAMSASAIEYLDGVEALSADRPLAP